MPKIPLFTIVIHQNNRGVDNFAKKTPMLKRMLLTLTIFKKIKNKK